MVDLFCYKTFTLLITTMQGHSRQFKPIINNPNGNYLKLTDYLINISSISLLFGRYVNIADTIQMLLK